MASCSTQECTETILICSSGFLPPEDFLRGVYLHLPNGAPGGLGEDGAGLPVVPVPPLVAPCDALLALPDAGLGIDGVCLGQLGPAQQLFHTGAFLKTGLGTFDKIWEKSVSLAMAASKLFPRMVARAGQERLSYSTINLCCLSFSSPLVLSTFLSASALVTPLA